MKGELNLITDEQVALREDVRVTTDGVADRLTTLENRIDHLKGSRAASRS